jgi:hypothetical protein
LSEERPLPGVDLAFLNNLMAGREKISETEMMEAVKRVNLERAEDQDADAK